MLARWIRGFGAALLLTASTASLAHAEPTEAVPSAERLWKEGFARFERKDYKGALEAFTEADAIVKAPTTGRARALALMNLGRLVEARDEALRVAALPQSPGEPSYYEEARKLAATLAEELGGRIPSSVVNVRGTLPADAVQVRVGRAAASQASAAFVALVDPGTHEVIVSSPGYRSERQVVTVSESRVRELDVVLAAERPHRGAPLAAPPSPAPPAAVASRSGPPAWAWVTAGVGLASVAVGTGFAIEWANARGQINADCKQDDLVYRCREGYTDATAEALEVRHNRSLGLAVGFGSAGALALTAGILGGLIAPRYAHTFSPAPHASHSVAAVSGWFAPQSGGVVLIGGF